MNECLGVEEEGQSSESESYEEYTWCNVTRVRATSMLTPEARASECGYAPSSCWFLPSSSNWVYYPLWGGGGQNLNQSFCSVGMMKGCLH